MAHRKVKHVLFHTNWWQSDLVLGVARHAAQHGWHVDTTMLRSSACPSTWHGDGVITTLSDGAEQWRKFSQGLSCPVIALNLNYPELECLRIGIDNTVAGRMAAQHFLERGFRDFLFYARVETYAARARRDAFAAALAEAGYGAAHLFGHEEIGGSHSWDDTQRLLSSKLRQLPRPLAVFAHDDSSGTEVIEACLEQQILIPDEVAVLGMLDIELYRVSTMVPLSSICVNFDEHARIACNVLADMMEGKPAPTRPILVPPTGIAVRQSTDTIAVREPKLMQAIACMRAQLSNADLAVADVARAVGVSTSSLHRLYRADLGSSPGAVLIRLRVEAARKLLVETNRKVEDIAQSCGFGNRINLYRNMKKVLNTTPAAYRKGEKPDSGEEGGRVTGGEGHISTIDNVTG